MLKGIHKILNILKQFLKYAVSLVAFGYVAYKFTHTPFSFDEVKQLISLQTLLICFFLTLGNWYFECLKWKLVINTFSPISYFTAAYQTLIAYAYGLITPLNSGSYLKKMFYYPKKKHKRVVLLNVYKGLYQMLSTVIFGLWGFYILLDLVDFNILNQKSFILILTILIPTFLVFFRKKIHQFLIAISKQTHALLFLYSMLKYVCFSNVIFLLLYKPDVNATTLYAGIGIVYMLSSLLPVFNILDFAIKGSMALFVLTPLGLTELEILIGYFILWIFNHALPALTGSIIQFYPLKKATV